MDQEKLFKKFMFIIVGLATIGFLLMYIDIYESEELKNRLIDNACCVENFYNECRKKYTAEYCIDLTIKVDERCKLV